MALALAIPAYAGVVVGAFQFWRYSIVGCIIAAASTSPSDSQSFFAIGVFFLVLALLWLLLLVGVYSLLLKFLWDNPPLWSRPPKVGKLLIRDFPILVISVLPIVAVFAMQTFGVATINVLSDGMRVPRLSYDELLIRFWGFWLITSAYLYQVLRKKDRTIETERTSLAKGSSVSFSSTSQKQQK
jgi:hypothetical protein